MARPARYITQLTLDRQYGLDSVKSIWLINFKLKVISLKRANIFVANSNFFLLLDVVICFSPARTLVRCSTFYLSICAFFLALFLPVVQGGMVWCDCVDCIAASFSFLFISAHRDVYEIALRYMMGTRKMCTRHESATSLMCTSTTIQKRIKICCWTFFFSLLWNFSFSICMPILMMRTRRTLCHSIGMVSCAKPKRQQQKQQQQQQRTATIIRSAAHCFQPSEKPSFVLTNASRKIAYEECSRMEKKAKRASERARDRENTANTQIFRFWLNLFVSER